MLLSPKYILHHLVKKNRFNIGNGNTIALPGSSQRLMKRTRIKVLGSDNQLLIGENVELANCEIRLGGSGNTIKIGDGVRFREGKIYLLRSHKSEISIGSETTVEGAYLLIDEDANISIGRDCMLSTDIIIRTGDKHSILDVATGQRINNSRDIRIADRVWIGRDVQILKGSVLQAETIVATRSLVTRMFDEGNCVIAGVPAKVVKRGVAWDRRYL